MNTIYFEHAYSPSLPFNSYRICPTVNKYSFQHHWTFYLFFYIVVSILLFVDLFKLFIQSGLFLVGDIHQEIHSCFLNFPIYWNIVFLNIYLNLLNFNGIYCTVSKMQYLLMEIVGSLGSMTDWVRTMSCPTAGHSLHVVYCCYTRSLKYWYTKRLGTTLIEKCY